MNVNEAKLDLMTRTKKGIAMFYVGTIFWLLMGILNFMDIDVKLLGVIYLVGIGILFPLGILVSKLLKIDFIAAGNPLSNLGGVLGGMQMLFAPILILVFIEKIEWLPFFIAILTGAHFLPYAILYKSKAYFFQSFGVVGFTSIIALISMNHLYSVLPFVLSAVYLITILLLSIENKKLMAMEKRTDVKKASIKLI